VLKYNLLLLTARKINLRRKIKATKRVSSTSILKAIAIHQKAISSLDSPPRK